MNLIAHRGLYNNKSEQNTMKAFINAINDSDYVGFECEWDNHYAKYYKKLLDNKEVF